MTNKEKFLELVSKEQTSTLQEVKQRIKNRAMLRESQRIAMKVLFKLDELGWSQKKLANEMSVSPQFINKLVSGKENLTIETLLKIQTILDIPVFASYAKEKEKNKHAEMVMKFTSVSSIAPAHSFSTTYKMAKVIKLDLNEKTAEQNKHLGS
ncbi:MAG: helix-turn-helix transcriptional regulator [Bacteroidia bacterium]